MNEIFKTKFVSLLSDTSVVANEEIQNAYVDFVVQVGTLSQSEPDYEKSIRRLNLTRIELDSSGSAPLYGQGEKCLEKSIYSKGNRFHQLQTGASMS